ncbi:hypothetical protein MUU72_12740 [Streptomyces sp. RS10V-4]|uniref:hypothetical protein n=1 Tax=Streptomyces rhizoryzae TaxID=2932493 RepID=UPI002004BB08|nr:hypothetical protein [Streptomyces rhizoryzae]MCK7623954.1 hypothetical protein [Streptomyces rhizoryzae]
MAQPKPPPWSRSSVLPPSAEARAAASSVSSRRLDHAGQVVETLEREPAWPGVPTAQIDRFCRVLDRTCPNPSGPAEHLPHAAFLAAAYASAATARPVDPKEYLA